MSEELPASRLISIGALLTMILGGCGPVPVAATSLPGLPALSTQLPAPPPIAESTTVLAPSPVASRTVSARHVTVKTTGNLFIRRGPDQAFNPLSVLPKGQVAYPTGRDVLANWLRIPLPQDPARSGWISIMSDFTAVTGDVKSLPEVEPTEWPQPAFLRNCTLHEMMIEPGGMVIPGRQSFPKNDARINPGSYAVLDIEVDEYPEVLHVDIREGSAVDILFDGTGEKKKCPGP